LDGNMLKSPSALFGPTVALKVLHGALVGREKDETTGSEDGLAWLLNGEDVGACGKGPTAQACLDFGQLFGGRPWNSATSEKILDSGVSATLSAPSPAELIPSGMVAFS
jgi:hypothetical protein